MTRNPRQPRGPAPEARPLPASLTQFLSDPGTRIVEPSRGNSRAASPNVAMRLAIGWAVIYNVAGFAILWWLWSTMG